MKTLSQLIDTAKSFRDAKVWKFITATKLGQHLLDILEYLNIVDKNSNSMSVKIVYASVAAMNADVSPVYIVDEVEFSLKFGQIVAVASGDGAGLYSRISDGWEYIGPYAGNAASQLSNDSNVNGTTVKDALNHVGSDILSQSLISERNKFQNIEPENRGIVKIRELYDIRTAPFMQLSGAWSKYGFWSWATAKHDMVVDEIGVHVYSLSALTGDLRVKIFVDGVSVSDLTKLNANLGDTTVGANIETIDLGRRLIIKSGQIISVGWEISNSEKIQLVHCTIAVDGAFEFGLNQMNHEPADGSIISATEPIETPASGEWYLPFYLNSYKVYDTSNPNAYAIATEIEESLVNHESNKIHEVQVEDTENALNVAGAIADKYIEGNGSLQDAGPAGTFSTTDYIDWRTFTEFVVGKDGAAAIFYGKAQYDSAKIFIAGTHSNGVGESALSKATGAKYFRLCYEVALMNQINFGDTVKPYSEYRRLVEQDLFGNPIVFRPNMADEALVAKFAEVESTTTEVGVKAQILARNGGTAYNETGVITPIGNIWTYLTTYTDKWLAVWYKGVSTKIINRVSVPLAKNFVESLDFTDGITVKVFHNGTLIKTKDIPYSEVEPFNALTTSSPIDDFFYDIDILPIEIVAGDTLFVGIECDAVADKIAMVFAMNETPSDTSEWTRNYTASGNDVNHIIGLTAQPTTPTSEGFYRVIRFSFVDYIAKQIDDKISGVVARTDLSLMPPKKIYNVFNDIKGTGDNALFDVRFHSATLFFDHLVKGISKDLDMNFTETGKEKINLFAPEITTPTSSVVKSIAFDKGAEYNGGTIFVIQKNVKESVGADLFPKILAIGDSVTSGYLAGVGNIAERPSQYWAVIKEQFEQSKIDAGDGAGDHNCLMVGHYSYNNWLMTYGGVTARPMKVFAEGFGGWCSTTHMCWSMNWQTRGQGLWDALGLGNGTGTDWTGSALQQESMMTTPEGYLTPKDTAAFLAFINAELGLSLATYSAAVAALDAKEANPDNPFYDKVTASDGVLAFNMLTYLNRYKTLNNDGVTRLGVGTTAGTKVTDVNAYDVCLPTHIIIQHSHNDGNVAWFADNMRKWTDAIKAEYTTQGWDEPFIGISVIRHTGTYYPLRYPMFDKSSIALWSSDPTTGYDNTQKIIDEYWVSDANEDAEKIFILPSMHVQPPAWGIPFRRVDTPEFDITGLSEHMYRVIDGAGPNWHPNALAHRCWGMQMYAWIRYTLSL